MRQIEAKLHESEENNKTLKEINNVLRSQLDTATNANEKLACDVKKISENWKKQREDDETRVGFLEFKIFYE